MFFFGILHLCFQVLFASICFASKHFVFVQANKQFVQASNVCKQFLQAICASKQCVQAFFASKQFVRAFCLQAFVFSSFAIFSRYHHVRLKNRLMGSQETIFVGT